MRTVRSSAKRKMPMPSSCPSRPIFQASKVRTAQSSMGTPPVVRPTQKITWRPLWRWYACNTPPSCRTGAGRSRPAVSVAHRVGARGAWKSCAAARIGSSSSPSSRARGRARRRERPITLELHARRVLRARRGLEVRLLVEARAEEAGHQHRGEAEALGVEGLRRLVEAHALSGDPVLGALELRLEVAEVLVRLQLRVALHRHHQPAEGSGELTLRCLEALEGLRVI